MTVQGILHALSDPVRVEIFSQLIDASCTQNCTAFLNVGQTPLPKSTLSYHFRVLREAGLVYSERSGVEVQNRARCADFKHTFGDLIGAILDAYKKERARPARARSSAPRTRRAKTTR